MASMDKSMSTDLYDLVSDFDVAMLVTHGTEGIHARPMTIARLDKGMCNAYLVTDVSALLRSMKLMPIQTR